MMDEPATPRPPWPALCQMRRLSAAPRSATSMTIQRRLAVLIITIVIVVIGIQPPVRGQSQLPSGVADFVLPGTQHGALNPLAPSNPTPIQSPSLCGYCHTNYFGSS